jgi:FkbM family methyltransferase
VKFYSQIGQDRFLLENFFRGKRGGVFVDVGAYDGEKFSNTLFYERSMGWTGLCIEPLPSAFAKLTATRRAIAENVCVADFEGEADFLEADDKGPHEKMFSGMPVHFDPRHVRRLEYTTAKATRRVKVTRLSSLLEKHGLTHIDYLSLDTEGSELAILSELDFRRFDISVLTVEDNWEDKRLTALMAEKGYDVFARLEQDIVFRRKDVRPLARSTVFCAVWHKDPERHALLEGHAENLARQTVAVDSLYVFDGGDTPPAWLKERAISVREPLSIYQAWNVALSLVATPLVMNLNLDDRLAPDAIEILEREILRSGAVLAGGEWKICYSQAETDAVEPCYPAQRLPYIPTWPPKPGTATRLGSGTGERGTYGPATIWRMDAHIGRPRYPWRLSEGTPIETAGDLAWWTMLTANPRVKIARLPLVIGHYHSHPQAQAEFRSGDERALFADPGVSLL